MSYRPQRAIITPPGYRDEEFIYPVLGSQIGVLAAGQEITNVPIPMDRDYPYFWTGVAYSTNAPSSIGLRFRDAYGTYLSDDYCSTTLYCYPANDGTFFGAFGGGFIALFEPPILCPAGSIPLVDFKNLTTVGGSGASPYDFELRGFKRLKAC